jgi:alcohol dehydrogenase class IV
VKSFSYGAPTELIFGAGSSSQAGAEVVRLGGTRVLLVTDSGLAGAGVADVVVESLDSQAGLTFCGVWAEVPQDPTFNDVEALVARVRADEVDTVVSLGSGSVLAAGRSAAVCAPSDLSVRDIARRGADGMAPLLSICLPTTAGSGGEVSRQATLADDETGEKSGVRGWPAAARLAILDPELLVSVPRSQAVASGIDAMTHALEAYWSRRATVLTDALARPSFSILFNDLLPSIEKRDTETLGRMLVASTMANLACGNAGLGLVHGLNKGVTGLAHRTGYPSHSYGMLHGVLLPWVVEFNIPACSPKLADLAADIGVHDPTTESPEEGAGRFLEAMTRWLTTLGAPSALDWPDCTDDDLDFIAKDTAGRAMWKDNPRQATEDELKALMRASLTDWTTNDWSTRA